MYSSELNLAHQFFHCLYLIDDIKDGKIVDHNSYFERISTIIE